MSSSPLPLFKDLRFRHVHLDFHTSGLIQNVGSKFSRKQFQEQLKAGHVNSINIFAKCHHGYSYHPTQVGQMHPGLSFDLLGEQITACHEIGVKAPVYVSSGLDEVYLNAHPGSQHAPLKHSYSTIEPGFKGICFNGPYLDYLCRQVKEIAARYEVDGWWFDIVGAKACYCRRCLAEMTQRGMDPNNPADALALGIEVQRRYMDAVNAAAREAGSAVPIFHNAGHISRGDCKFLDYVTHIELESLPTGGWGYDHFPVSAKYSATTGRHFLGMTGKFHTTWGEFGGFKHDNALRYECAAMLAYGARCAIGDQLHPLGEMNPETYRKVGLAYAEVEKKEPWCVDAAPVSEIAVLSVEALQHAQELNAHLADRTGKADAGVTRMLLQLQIMFDVIDLQADFSKYRLIIVPDEGKMDEALAGRLGAFVKAGGKLLLSGASGMTFAGDRFHEVFNLGTFNGRTGTDMDYLNVAEPLLKLDGERRMVRCPFVINGNSYQVKPTAGAQALVKLWHSQFSRDVRHYCSHQHAPEHRKSEYPGAFVIGNIGYIACEIFGQYRDRGQMLYRDLVRLMIQHLLGDLGNVQSSLPSCGRVSLMQQGAQNRYVLHLLYAAPIRRADQAFPRWGINQIEVIEDILPVHEVRCEVKLAQRIKAVRLAPEGTAVPFRQDAQGRVTFTVPKLDCHQMVELQY